MPPSAGPSPDRIPSPRDALLLACVGAPPPASVDAAPPAWVITRTRRLARSLTLRVAELRAAGGRSVAETPPIRDLDEWLRVLGDELLAGPGPIAGRILLGGAAERVLWEQVIAADEELGSDRPVLDVAALAASAAEAWSRLCLWGEPAWNSLGPLAGEVEAFRRWLRALRRRLDEGRFVTAAELSIEVPAALRRGELAGSSASSAATTAASGTRGAGEVSAHKTTLPGECVVLGFDRPDPALARFVAALEARGVRVRRGDNEFATSVAAGAPHETLREQPHETLLEQPHAASLDQPREALREQPHESLLEVLRAASPRAEVRAVGARIRTLLIANPDLRVGVLTPDPLAYAPLIERVFEEELDAAALVTAQDDSRRRFDFAEAPRLVDYPLVASALDLLSLDTDDLDFATVSRVLRSPYPRLEGATEEEAARERGARGAAEARLRRNPPGRLVLAEVASAVRASGAERFGAALDNLASHLARSRAERSRLRSPDAWRREWIHRLSRVLAWPGPLSESSTRAGEVEGLVFRRWRDAMDEFASLDAVEPAMHERHARSRLRAIAAATPVQPSSQGLGVQVMGLLDASGLEFDVVFAIGMTAAAFPAAPRPNPLLPVAWQRTQAGMPRASVEGERELAATVWQRVQRSAPQVIATFPAVGDGGEEHVASALVAELPCEDMPIADGEPWWLKAAQAAPEREARPPDLAVPPLVRRGGSSLVTHQSTCPFRAFTAVRLAAEPLPPLQPAPNPAQRGVLVHAALEEAYRGITNSVDLAGLSDANIAEHACLAAKAAIAASEFVREAAADLAASLEEWLADLVANWMRYERDSRTEPWEIIAQEEREEATYAAGESGASGAAGKSDTLTIRYRIDRIDQVGGGRLIIDYKTSATPKGAGLWAGERPEDLQLPLYMTLLEGQQKRVDGVAFANLAARDKCSLQGVAARELSDKLKPPSSRSKTFEGGWEDAVASMRAAVDAAARGYLSGDVRVAPIDAKVCRLCGAQAFCRVKETGTVDDGDEADEEENNA